MLNFGSCLSSENAIKGAFVLVTLLFPFVGDGLISWIVRDLVGSTFGFPTKYRVGDGDPRYDRSKPWVYFRTGGINGWTTIRVFCLATDDGLAFDVRSSFGFSMMRTVCVPWSALRAESASDHITDRNSLKFVVFNPDGSLATTLVPGVTADSRRLASIGQWIAQSGAEDSRAE